MDNCCNKDLQAQLEEHEVMIIPDANSCIIGIANDPVSGSMRAVYSVQLLTKWFMSTNGWDEEEAEEWMSFNVVGAYVGDGTPVFCDVLEVNDDFCTTKERPEPVAAQPA